MWRPTHLNLNGAVRRGGLCTSLGVLGNGGSGGAGEFCGILVSIGIGEHSGVLGGIGNIGSMGNGAVTP